MLFNFTCYLNVQQTNSNGQTNEANTACSGCHIFDVQGNSLDFVDSITVPITVTPKSIKWNMLIIEGLAEDGISVADPLSANDMSVKLGRMKNLQQPPTRTTVPQDNITLSQDLCS